MRKSKLICTLGLALLGGALFATGCGENLQWVKDEGATSQASQQLAACTLDAEKSRFSSDESGEARAERVSHWVSLCMRSSGWKQTPVAQ